MQEIDTLSKWVQGIITTGTVFRIVWCCVGMAQNGEEVTQQYKKRIKHAIIFLIFATLVFTIKDLIIKYYS